MNKNQSICYGLGLVILILIFGSCSRKTSSQVLSSNKFSREASTSSSDDFWPDPVYYLNHPMTSPEDKAKEHIRQHLDAANKLSEYKGSTCWKFSRETRSTCPLSKQLVAINNINRGVRIHFTSGLSLEAIVEHMQCHHAYSREIVHMKMDNCPLYLKNIQIRISPDGKAVEITSENSETVSEIHRFTRLPESP